jgi:beta-ribofuranosylaminobenzene 5'-phosphate synthase
MTRVTAPSRLHFGLLNVPVEGSAETGRLFGGSGVMIDQPGVVVTARPAVTWQFEGMHASRAQVFAHRFLATLDRAVDPLQILVERCPADHTGLGAGTQLGLAVGKSIAVECGLPELTAVDIAVRVGRGGRSAIGVHGFERGGLIAEPGKLPGETISPLLRCLPLPEAWRIAVFVPHAHRMWHGLREEQAFAAAGTSQVESLTWKLLQEVMPSAETGDLDAFGEAVHQFNRLAGEPFAAAQGGPYSSPEVAELIGRIRGLGVAGVGQSSWGPAVFAIVGNPEHAAWLVHHFKGTARGWVARQSIGHRVERS